MDFNLSAEDFWKKALNKRNASSEYAYPHLRSAIGTLLSLPASNASVERVFSSLKLIKTDNRSLIKRQTLLALLHTKNGLKRNGVTADRLDINVKMRKLHAALKSNATDENVEQIVENEYQRMCRRNID